MKIKGNENYQKNENCCSINYHFLYYMRLTIYQYLRTKIKCKYLVERIIHEAFKTTKLYYSFKLQCYNTRKIEYNRLIREILRNIYTNKYENEGILKEKYLLKFY